MSFLKLFFGKTEDDKLFDAFLIAMQKMDATKAEESIKKMSDEGLFKAANKIDELAKKNPSYIILNTVLFSEFVDRPHLRNPFS